MKHFSGIKAAIVHDWLTGIRGGERVLISLLKLFPGADIYTLVYHPKSMGGVLKGHKVITSFIQRLPGKDHRRYLPFFPVAIERFDLTGYDIIISSSHCVAKGVRGGPETPHVCYCHTPMRYVWDMYEEYFRPGEKNVAVRVIAKYIRRRLQRWDVRSADRPDYYIANSRHVQGRIARHYSRDSEVIHPPVDIKEWGRARKSRGDYYIVLSALVPYKRVDLAIEAVRGMDRKLVVVGEGPEMEPLKHKAPKNVEFIGRVSDEERAGLYAGARALIFPGVEDFGIVPLEAIASGCPVVAYAKGGVLEIVREGLSGTFFKRRRPSDIKEALLRAEGMKFSRDEMRQSLEEFSERKFLKKMSDFIDNVLKEKKLSK